MRQVYCPSGSWEGIPAPHLRSLGLAASHREGCPIGIQRWGGGIRASNGVDNVPRHLQVVNWDVTKNIAMGGV